MAKVSYAEGVISALEYYTYEMGMARDFGVRIRSNDGNNYII